MNIYRIRIVRCSALFLAAIVALLPVGCERRRGRRGAEGPQGPSQAEFPGVTVNITAVSGGKGPAGRFRVGDTISVNFTLAMSNGSDVLIDDLDAGGILVSGPTFNYQRVIAYQSDLITASTRSSDGSYTYTFSTPIPSAYLAPLNDTATFSDGELQGTALLSGTYTVGLEVYKDYTEDGETHRDAANATEDFLFGSATSLEPREVVQIENCNRCHVELRAHDDVRRDTKLCVLCHTTGAEDENDASVEGGTPDITVDFRVLVHKIHNGAHLPSVLGVATNSDGSRNYSATATPYRVVGGDDSVEDFSEVGFPVWPNLSIAMPRDQGYSSLTTGQKTTEDTIRMGVTACEKCHGDPDGSGELTAPDEGDLAYAQPSRRACGSCHDDVNFAYPYTANGQTMEAQTDDSLCVDCHAPSGDALAVEDAHVHPFNSTSNAGLNFSLTTVAEAGTNDGDGTIDPGEKVAITFTMTDDAAAAVAPSGVASISTVLSGPTTNLNLILSASIATAALTGSPPYTINVPESVVLEFAGDSTGSLGDVFTTSRTPHWNVTGARTTVNVRTATSGGSTTLSAGASALSNYADVASATDFARSDYVVIDDGEAEEEYLQIGLVDGSRLWFNSGLRNTHSSGASILEVTLTSKTESTDYSITASSGELTELVEMGSGNAVVVSYTTDFVMPTVHPRPLNDSPDLGETWGEWKGLSIADGTYRVGIWGYRNVTVALYGETQTYRGTSSPAYKDFLVGSAATIVPYGLISSGDNCNACHDEVLFHGGGRRGFDTCVLCHGTAGSEDRPQYVAGSAPATSGVTINFRTMLHKIHRGEELANASTYTVNGFGSGAYPNNYTSYTYEEIVFPAMPGGVKQCDKCHGSSEAWQSPAARDHADQTSPTLVWYAACTSCHDSTAVDAHVNLMTYSGVESCDVCHGSDKEFSVERVHASE